MNVKRAIATQAPGYPSRRQYELNAKVLGLMAVGVGSLLATGCLSGKPVVDCMSDVVVTTTAGLPAFEPLSETSDGTYITDTNTAVIHVVQSGETLSGIARQKLGDAARWREIAALNPGMDPDKLKVGQRLVLPKTGGRQ